MAWVGPILGYIPFNAEIQAQAVANIKSTFNALERYLERNTFLVGERLTLADIVCAAQAFLFVCLFVCLFVWGDNTPPHEIRRATY